MFNFGWVKDYYRVLGLPFGASVEQVRARYRELARLYHPDVSADPEAEEKMRQLNEAYRILSSPEMRLRYHLFLAAQRERRRRARQKAFQKVWAAYQGRTAPSPAFQNIPFYLRYILVGLLLTVFGSAVVYHFYHPFLVKKADLAEYGWSAWPPFLELPPTLTEIYLQGNRFSEVPEVIWDLSRLQVLRLDRNKLHRLSSRITLLRDLEVLSLRENKLTALPRGWGEMHRLREVDLRDNRLREVPLELLDLPNLVRLDLRGNPLSSEMRWILTRRRHPAILWDEPAGERDHSLRYPTDDSAEAVSGPASLPSTPHASE